MNEAGVADGLSTGGNILSMFNDPSLWLKRH